MSYRDTEEQTTEAGVVASLVRQSLTEAPIRQDHDGITLLIWPKTRDVVSLEKFDQYPRRKRGVVTLIEPESFASYVKQHRNSRTIVLGTASETGGKFRAILDYHRPETQYENPEKEDAAAKAATENESPNFLRDAGWGDHVAEYPLVPTPEWSRWIGKSGQAMTQSEFAQFLEDNAEDIVVPSVNNAGYPDAQLVLSTALTLQAKTDIQFKSGIRLSNGQHQLTYVENIDAKAGIDGQQTIPDRFALALAPFKGSIVYEVRARLKYRLGNGRVNFTYELERAHKVVEHAYNDLRKKIGEAVGGPVLAGEVKLVSP